MKGSRFFFLAILVSVFGGAWQSTFSQTVTRGPYLQIGTPTSIVVRWRTSSASDSRVRYGTTQGSLNSIADDASSTTEHIVQLDGLSPNTKYFYSIGTSSATLAGDDANHYFFTSPTGSKSTRVWALGDAGTANGDQRAVRDAYYNFTGSRHTDLWLMLGDNAYNNGTDAEFQGAVFENMYEAMLMKSVLWPTRGNHDRAAEGGTMAYYNIFSLPTRGEAGGMSSGTEAYYSFDYGNIHFICLESTSGALRSANSAMWTWLRSDLSSNDKTWTIAFWHHPPYSKGSHNSDSEGELVDMRTHANPILEEGGVDLVLGGHSHSYERSFLVDGHYGTSSSLNATMLVDAGDGRTDGSGAYSKNSTSPAPHAGAVYIVAGSSGKTGGGSLNHPVMYTSFNTLGSVVLDFNSNRLNVTFLDDNGARKDYFTMEKPNGDPPPSQVATPDISPNSGTFVNSVQVSLSTTTAAATIRYTLNGSDPVGSSTLYTSPFTLTSDATVKARAFKSGMNDSEIASADFNITSPPPPPPVSQVATPVIDPNGGTFANEVEVSLSTSTPDATICYTLNGNNPNSSSTLYNGQFTLTNRATVKARAFKSGMTDSNIASENFTITSPPPPTASQVATPEINPNGGSFVNFVEVSLSTATPDATIRYTVNGNNPNGSSTLYDSPFSLSNDATVRARAFKSGMTDSDIASADFTISSPPPPGPPVAQKGIWISDEELAKLSMSGGPWSSLKSEADRPTGSPDVSNQDDDVNVRVMAKALVYARTNDESYRSQVIQACTAAIDTEKGGRTLALGRELAAYVIAADLVGLPESDDQRFRAWLRETLSENLSGMTLRGTHEQRPNNWGTHAGASRAAVAVYLDDQAEIERTAKVFKGWVGDRSSYDGFKFGDLSWQADPANPVGINPVGSTKEGHNIDGVLPDDQRRGGGFRWPPPKENYTYGALQGVVAQAYILYRAGYDTFNWENRAILRALQWLHNVADFPPGGDDQWVLPLIDHIYGTNFWNGGATGPGKNLGWADWTHSKRGDGGPPPDPQPNRLVMISGNDQTAPTGSILPNAFVVEARNGEGQPLSGIEVTFAVTAGGGSLSNSQPRTTGADGRASTTLTLGNSAGNNRVTATASGFTGSPQTFNSTGTSNEPNTPTISSFSPASGPVGTAVTINGANFTDASVVEFNGTAADNPDVQTSSRIVADVPSGATTGKITVTTDAGTATSANNFVVTTPPTDVNAPVISNFSPGNGPVGTEVTINGQNFDGANNVSFNGTSANDFEVATTTRILAIVPPGATTGKITVSNAAGTGTSANNFTVTQPPPPTGEAPTIASFSPTSGPAGTEVAINGANFDGTTRVRFNGAQASNFDVELSSRISTVVPQTATTGKISVTTPAGTATSANNFIVTAPPQSGGGVTFFPTDDAYVRSATPTSNHGSLPTLRTRKSSRKFVRTFLKFSISDFDGSVQRALLRLFVVNRSRDGGEVFLVSNNFKDSGAQWDQDGLNWNNAPDLEGEALAAVGDVQKRGWVEYDVTAAVDGNGTYSFALQNDIQDVLYFSSQEGEQPPELMLFKRGDPAASVASGSGQDGALASDISDEEEAAVEQIPETLILSPAYPNPFNGHTTIKYGLPENGEVHLVIYNSLGQVVRRLVNEIQKAGYKRVLWDAADDGGKRVSSGVYLYRLEFGSKHINGRVILQQ